MLIGPAILLLPALSISNRDSGWFTPYDVAYLCVLGLVRSPGGMSFAIPITGGRRAGDIPSICASF